MKNHERLTKILQCFMLSIVCLVLLYDGIMTVRAHSIEINKSCDIFPTQIVYTRVTPKPL